MLNFHWTLIQLTHKKKELSLNLKQNQEILFNITLLCFKKKQQPFKAHMTIAHRDLNQQVFPLAWAYFSKLNFRRSFQADSLTLLKHENGRWSIEKVFEFS